MTIASVWATTWVQADEPDSLATQMRYNRDAVAAMHAGDHQQAVLLLRSALTLGELNMTWLNLGRAQHHLRQCEPAADAFDRVADAPAVETPSRAEVAAVLETWRAELDTACNATLVLSCATVPDGLWIEGAEREVGCDGAIPVVPGAVRVAAVYGQERVELEVEVGSEIATLEIAPPEPSTDPAPAPFSPPEPDNGLAIAGYTVAGFGAAAIVAGLIMDATLVGPKLDEYRDAAETDAALAAELKPGLLDRQAATLGVTFAGVGVLAIGVTLVVIDLSMGPDDPALPQVALSPTGALATWRW